MNSLRAGDPPAYLWATPETMPDWVIYTPNLGATLFAARLLARLFRPPYLLRPAPCCA